MQLPLNSYKCGKESGVPVGLVAGVVEDKEVLLSAGFSFVKSITPEGMPLEEAIKKEVAFSNLRHFAAPLI